MEIDRIKAFDMMVTFLENKAPRDEIINKVLTWTKPKTILQVGAIEETDAIFRVWSGWSDLVFAEHLKDIEGCSLTIVDIDQFHLFNSAIALSNYPTVPVTFVLDDAINHINGLYDFIYLDGSNDPQETLEQFNKVDRKASSVLIDDFDIKGTLIKENCEHFKVANGLGYFPRIT